MFIFGGFIPNKGYCMDIYRVNLSVAIPQWEKIITKSDSNKFPIERMFHSTTLFNDFIYLIGGIKNGVPLSIFYFYIKN